MHKIPFPLTGILVVGIFFFAFSSATANEPITIDGGTQMPREQDLSQTLPSEYTKVQLIPKLTTVTRRREQPPAEGATNISYHLRDTNLSERTNAKERVHPLIFKPENLELDLLKNVNVTAHDFIANEPYRTLPECIQRAAAAHLPLNIAFEKQDLAKKRVSASLRELFPELELNFEDTKGSSDGTGNYKGQSWRVNMRQPLFRGRQLWSKLREEKENFRSSLMEYDEVLNNLTMDVSKAYIELFRASEALKERQNVFEESKLWRNISTEKEESQLISEIERLNVESVYHEQMAQLEIAKQDIHLARLELQKLLGLEIIDQINVAPLYKLEELMSNETFVNGLMPMDNSGFEHEASKSLEDYIQLAYKHRPELELNVHKVKANQFAETGARGGFQPSLDLIAEVGQLFETSTHLDTRKVFGEFDEEKEYRFGFEMDWNFAGSTFSADSTNTKNAPNNTSFRGGGEGAAQKKTSFSLAILDNLDQFVEVKEAAIETKESIEELEQAEKQVVADVERAYYDYQKARVEMISFLRRLDYRQRLSKLSEVRLEKNEIQISEFLQNRTDLANDRIQLHRSMADFFISKAGLNRAVGLSNLTDVEDIYA